MAPCDLRQRMEWGECNTQACDMEEDACKPNQGYDVAYCKIFKRIEANVIKRNNYEFPYSNHHSTDLPAFLPHTNSGPLLYNTPGGL